MTKLLELYDDKNVSNIHFYGKSKGRYKNMAHYIKYYVNDTEINDVMEGLKTLREKRLISKFAKTIGVSQSGLNAISTGDRKLSACTLKYYNKILLNIDTFLEEYE